MNKSEVKRYNKAMKNIYDYVFPVNAKEYKSFKATNFSGTYLVNWGKGKVTKERI